MRIRRELALLSFLGLVACGSGGTHVTFNGSESSGSAPEAAVDVHLQYLFTTQASYGELSAFGEKVIAHTWVDGDDNDTITVVDQDGNDIESHQAKRIRHMSADPVTGSVAFFSFSDFSVNYLESVSGAGWSIPLSDSLQLNLTAVHGTDVVISGYASEPTSVRCSSKVKGTFLARFRGGKCIEAWSPFPAVKDDKGEDTYPGILAMTFGPDGSLALGGVFDTSMDAGGQPFNSAGSSDMFVTVLEQDGSFRFTKVAGSDDSDTIRSMAWSGDGSKVFVGGTSSSDLDFGDGKRRTHNGDGFLSAFDATTGEHLWAATLGDTGRSIGDYTRSELRVGGVDGNRVVVNVSNCQGDNDTVVLESGSPGSHPTCIGAFNTDSGDRLYMMRIGPKLPYTETLAGNGGFWLASSFEGRPDFGNGKVTGGHDVFARYVFR